MIVITAPTGNIGHQVLENVLDSGEPIRVIARDPSRLPAHTRERVEVVQGSHGDIDVVTKAFAGADSVFWLVPPDPHAESVEAVYVNFARPACDACTSQEVRRVVGVSALGRRVARNAGYVSASLAMDDLIASAGVSYRALTMPSFMDNILRQTEAIKSQGVFFSPISGDRKLPTCATRDIAAVAATLLLDHSWSGVDSVPVLGPEDLSFKDMAQIMSEVPPPASANGARKCSSQPSSPELHRIARRDRFMELGFHLPIFDIDGGTTAIAGELARVGTAAEESGATWLSFMDHYFQIEPTGLPAESNMLEGYTTLGYLAAHTFKIDLSLLVTGVTYRHPGLLAKIVTTLDVLSGGRAVLGIGAAWFEREHRGLGVPFPPVAERFERLEETLRICGQLWDPENNGPFEGKHYRLAETLCSPQPINRPKVLIGGGGERRTLRLVAQYGDACNLFASSPEDVEHKLDVLRRHCDDVGRDYDQVRKTITANNPRPSPDTRDEFVRQMAGYAKLGVHAVIVTPTTGSPAAWIDGMAPAVPQLAELG